MKAEISNSSTSGMTAGPAAANPLASRHGASIAQGLFKHGEHFPDLILVQGATKDRRFFETFRAMTGALLSNIEAGSIDVNEKYDGRAAIMMGRDRKDKPFVATKHGFDKKRPPQKLMTTLASVRKAYPTNLELRKAFNDCVRFLQPRIDEALREEFKDLIVQGDIIFTPTFSKKDRNAAGIEFTPNAVKYSVPSSDPLHTAVDKAYVGVVIHTAYLRSVDPETKLVTVRPHPDQQIIRILAKRLSSEGAFVMHPWRDGVKLPVPSDFKGTVAAKVEALLEGIDGRLKLLGDDFIAGWNIAHLDKFRVFINSGLGNQMHGGLFKAAREGEPFDYDRFVTEMRAWVAKRAVREPVSAQSKEGSYALYKEKFDAFAAAHPVELRAMLEAFYGAVQTQYALIPHLKPALASRLGGESGEGMMLRHGEMVVKFVDRLDFTLKNNALWNRGTLMPPFDVWRPGMRIIPMKLQPLHKGHLAMIRKAVEEADGAPVVVLASKKEPNTHATTVAALKAAKDKTELSQGKYSHIFSRALRAALLKEADFGGATVVLAETKVMESYLARYEAEEAEGKVKLVIGEKEIKEQRYKDQLDKYAHILEQQAQPMTEDGISGTEVRDALKRYAETRNPEALAFLHDALGYVQREKRRQALIDRMASEFEKVERAAKRILEKKPKRRAAKAKRSAGKKAAAAAEVSTVSED